MRPDMVPITLVGFLNFLAAITLDEAAIIAAIFASIAAGIYYIGKFLNEVITPFLRRREQRINKKSGDKG